jgi:hypothetical protein
MQIKTVRKLYCLTHQKGLQLKGLTVPIVGKAVEQKNLLSIAGENVKCSSCGKVSTMSITARPSYVPTILPYGNKCICPRKKTSRNIFV